MVHPSHPESTPESTECNGEAIGVFVQMVLEREDLQFRLSSCQSVEQVVALPSVVGLDISPDKVRALAAQHDRSCPHWPWIGQSRRFLKSFLGGVISTHN